MLDVRISRLRGHDHDGMRGVFSVVGVKYTAVRQVAEKVIAPMFQMWGKSSPSARSGTTAVYGGGIERLRKLVEAEMTKHSHDLSAKAIQHLVQNYGSAYSEVTANFKNVHRTDREEPWVVLRAEILHGVRSEMAQKLTDSVCRRIEIGSAANPGDDMIVSCGNVMHDELDWTSGKTQQEIQEARAVYAWG